MEIENFISSIESLTVDLTGQTVVVAMSSLGVADGGVTTETSQSFTIEGDNNAVTGSISWSWTGPGGTCVGTDSVTLTRN